MVDYQGKQPLIMLQGLSAVIRLRRGWGVSAWVSHQGISLITIITTWANNQGVSLIILWECVCLGQSPRNQSDYAAGVCLPWSITRKSA